MTTTNHITITSQRNKFNFYFPIAVAFIFFFSVASLLAWIFITQMIRGVFPSSDFMVPVISVVFFYLTYYTVVRYFKNAPIITIEGERITFGKESHLLKDIESVYLTGKVPFKYIFRFPMEGTTLNFKNGTTKYIYDDIYSNSAQLKSFLDQVVVKKKPFVEQNDYEINLNAIDVSSAEVFKGNPIFSLRGLNIMGLIGFFIYLSVFKVKNIPIGFVIGFSLFSLLWIYLNARLMNYIRLTGEYLIINNHILVWKKSIYRIHDIKEIVFEEQRKAPYSLRIITKDFRNKLYPAATLRDKTWLQLKGKLEIHKIKVRNEIKLLK
jgi:hypothetical protein